MIMVIERVEEYCLTEQTKNEISDLLQNCFSDYPKDRIFFRQAPQFRLLAREKQDLIAQMGVEYRDILIEQKAFSIFGICDLCVRKDFRSRKVGASLIKELESLGKSSGVNFLVLMASEQDFYHKLDFIPVQNVCRWVILTKKQTLGVANRSLHDSLMIKKLGEDSWPEGLVDFMGHLF
jgi:predicted N-acetyltransferase YhbS